MNESTIDLEELSKFEQHADAWWNLEGPLKTLHDINPVRLEFILNHQALTGKKMLDVGCGGGVLTEAMSKEGAHCTGIDAEQQVIDVAIKHASDHKLDIHYEAIAIEAFEGNHFDVVTCMEMLEHVKNPQLVLQHCARLLKPGGWLFLSTLNRTLKAYSSAIIVAEYVLGLLPKQTHDYSKFITPSELAKMLRQSGFDVKDIQGMAYHPFLRTASLSPDVSVNYLLACQKRT